MNRPRKKHCQYPLAALCLSCKWFRPDFLLHQWVICTTLAARLGTPGEPGQRQLCSVVCLFWADSLCRGNKLEHWKSGAVSPRGNITAEALLLRLLVSVWAALLPTATQVATVCKIQALGDTHTLPCPEKRFFGLVDPTSGTPQGNYDRHKMPQLSLGIFSCSYLIFNYLCNWET